METSPVTDVGALPQSSLRNLRVLNKIGRGSFGAVYKCIYNGRQCALKRINLTNTRVRPEWIRDRLVKEISLLHQVSSRCKAFVKIHSSCIGEDGQVMGYVMEYFQLGNLRAVFNKMRSFGLDCKTFPWLAVHLLHQVAEGLRFLQDQVPVMIHRDVAVDNVFVSSNLQAKLGDFGLSRRMQDAVGQDTLHFENLVGIERRTPELLLDPLRQPDDYIDRYLFGICLFEALTCSSLRQRFGDNVAQFRDMLIEGRQADYLADVLDRDCFSAYPKRLGQESDEFQYLRSTVAGLMRACLATDPLVRPPFSHICRQLEEAGAVQSDGVSREKDLALTLLQPDRRSNDSWPAADGSAELGNADMPSGWAATRGGSGHGIRTTDVELSMSRFDSGLNSMPTEFRYQFGENLRVGTVQGAVYDVDASQSQSQSQSQAQAPERRRFTRKPAPHDLLAAIFRSGPLRNAWPELLSALGAPQQAVNEAALAARKAGRQDAEAAMESLRLLPAQPTVNQLAEGLVAARCSDSTLRLLGRLQDKFCSPLSSVESSGAR